MAVTYNNLSFAYCQTELNSAGTETDPSGADQTLTVIRLKIRGVLNPEFYPALNSVNSDPAATLARIRHMMTAPRKPLYYDLVSPPYQKIGPAILDLPTGRDDALGPMPDADAFSAVYTTPKTIEVTWAVTVKLRDCGSSRAYAPLSYRWETSIEFDKFWKATVRQTGYAIFSAQSHITPDSFRRTQLTPAVLPGFAREQAHYRVSSDGLRCDFEFVDGQIRYAPPYPVIDMDIVQSESFPLHDGMRLGEITVSMRGMINANPLDLEYWCFVVGWARMKAALPLTDEKTGRILGQAMFSTHETKDSIDATFTLSYKVDPTQGGQAELRSGNAAFQKWASGFIFNTSGNFGSGAFGPDGSAAGLPASGDTGFLGGNSISNILSQVSEQGRITARNQPFPWVGVGTSPPDPVKQSGFANWASPGASIVGPPQGIGLANAVVLYAALLRDPCGAALPPMPNAQQIVTTVSPNPAVWNTPAGGSAGATPSTQAQLTAALSQFTAQELRTTPYPTKESSPYQSDPRPGAYDLWQCSAEYVENPGVIVVPTSDPAGTSIKIRYASTQWTLRVKWVAKRTGSYPVIPQKRMTDPNWVYVGGTIPIREMRMGADQVSYVYEASGVYEFMSLDPEAVKLLAAIPPTLATSELSQVVNWTDVALNLGRSTAATQNQLITVGSQGSGSAGGTGGNNVLTGSGGSPLGGNPLSGAPTN